MPNKPPFKLDEFIYSPTALRLNIDNTPPLEIVGHLTDLIDAMKIVREILGNKPIYITSGYRSKELNQAVNGSRYSAHMEGFACDFISPMAGTPKKIFTLLESDPRTPRYDELILEPTWVHFSIHPRLRGRASTASPK